VTIYSPLISATQKPGNSLHLTPVKQLIIHSENVTNNQNEIR